MHDFALFKNLGIALQQLELRGGGTRESNARMVEVFTRYLQMAPPTDTQYQDIRAVVDFHSRSRPQTG